MERLSGAVVPPRLGCCASFLPCAGIALWHCQMDELSLHLRSLAHPPTLEPTVAWPLPPLVPPLLRSRHPEQPLRPVAAQPYVAHPGPARPERVYGVPVAGAGGWCRMRQGAVQLRQVLLSSCPVALVPGGVWHLTRVQLACVAKL